MICAPRFCIICVLGAFLYGCATATTPNSPYRGPGYPSNFSHLALRNPLLAMELGKIPELTDGISVKEKKALATIAKIYQEEPIGFDSAFTRLYKIGLPEVRKYCSPLQAIFWLAEDGELDKEFIHYSLRELLDKFGISYEKNEKSLKLLNRIFSGKGMLSPKLINSLNFLGQIVRLRNKLPPYHIPSPEEAREIMKNLGITVEASEWQSSSEILLKKFLNALRELRVNLTKLAVQ